MDRLEPRGAPTGPACGERRREGVIALLQNVARQLALLPTAEIQKHADESAGNLSLAESIGCMFDPTSYLAAQRNGEMDDARHQLEIVRHLLAARKAIDKREAHVAATGRGRQRP